MLAACIAFLILGVIAGILGFVAIRTLRDALKRRERLSRMKATLTSTVALAPLNEIVELTGTALPIDASQVLAAPIGGEPCLWWCVQVCEDQGSSISRLTKQTGACDFYIDDASGAVARVQMKDATIGLTSRTPKYDEARARLFLEKYAITTRSDIEKLLWFEEIIPPKTDVYVLGHARAPANDAKAKGPFRGGMRERFVIEKPADADLVVSVGHEALLRTKLESEEHDATVMAKVLGVTSAVFTAISAGILYYILRTL